MKPIFQRPAKTYSNAGSYVETINELLKKNRNRNLYGNDAGLSGALYIDSAPRLPAANSDALAPKKTSFTPQETIQSLKDLSPADSQNEHNVFNQDLVDFLTEINPDELTPNQINLLNLLHEYQQQNFPSHKDNPPEVGLPLQPKSLMEKGLLVSMGLINPEEGAKWGKELSDAKENTVNSLDKAVEATGNEGEAQGKILGIESQIVDILNQQRADKQKELNERLNNPKIKVGDLTPREQATFLANKAEQLGLGGEDPLAGKSPSEVENFDMTTDPKTGMVVYKKKDPSFGEKIGDAVDELGTAINAPELHLSELLAGKNTRNSGRTKGLFDAPISPVDSTKTSPLASMVSSVFSPQPAYAAAQEEGSPNISMVGSSGGQSQSVFPAQNSISHVASSKPTVATKATPQLSTPAKVSAPQSATPAKPAMQAVPFVNMSPATLQSKVAPASVSKPSTPTQSNLATAAVNAIRSLFKR